MNIGKYLRKYRMDNGYSQEYVADVIGVSQKTYSNMENDKSNISFDTIKKLIDFYKIDVSNLDISKFISDGKLVLQNFEEQGTSSISSNNNFSDKLILQMEERIEELKARIRELESQHIKSKL